MSDPKRPLKVFLCHASADKPTVRELYKRLTTDERLNSEKLLLESDWKPGTRKARNYTV